ncbi:MAG: thiopurine S-methyltransferase [Gammaproteobacteria bacterium]|nr:thiopurine S-methyltransferase [Gammaproteobacteria bacterium]
MEKDFWHERWHRGDITFHRSDIHWALNRHWRDISGSSAQRVLVPLCGKSLDLRWLARRGHDVVGIELSRNAIEAFYRDWGQEAAREPRGALERWQAGQVEIHEGDFFDFEADSPFPRFYDRAALVALPAAMRQTYLVHLRSLLADDAAGLLVTFEYAQNNMDGPPFSVMPDELDACAAFEFELLERRDALAEHPGFAERGLAALRECAWRVTLV